MQLSEHMKETADIIAGYTTGRLVIETGYVGLLLDNGEEILLDSSHSIEVRNGNAYEPITLKEACEVKTAEGWPLYAGLYTRIKSTNTKGQFPMQESITEQVEAAVVVNAEYQAHQDKAIIQLKLLAEQLDPAGRAALETLEHELAQAQGVAIRRAYLLGLEAAGVKRGA